MHDTDKKPGLET